MNRFTSFVLLCSLVALASCDSTTSGPATVGTTSGGRVFILNQGNYTHNNASLDVWTWKDSLISSDLVSPLGDVGNDLQLINGKLYVVLDNSSKIVVVDPDSAAAHTVIQFPPFSAPAKIVKSSATEALVPELYRNEIAVINLASGTIASTIPVDSGQYSIAMLSGKAYSASASGKVLVIDPATKQITKTSAWIDPNPAQIVADSAHNVLILATSGDYTTTPGKIYWMDPSTLVPTDSIVLPMTSSFNTMFIGGNKAYVCFYVQQPQVIDLGTHSMAADPMLTKNYFGGIYDAASKLLYMGTVSDLIHNDGVDVFDLSSMKLEKSFTAGIAPGFFVVMH